jgi:5-methylcytosine-specific restriction endonuclease McrA
MVAAVDISQTQAYCCISMPTRPKRICVQCGAIFQATGFKCPKCRREADADRNARREQRNPRGSAKDRGYGPEWRKARAEYLRHNKHCVKCGVLATVVDHIRPHRGDQRLFWDRNNWQALCTRCHNRKTATQDGGFGRLATGVDKSDLDWIG